MNSPELTPEPRRSQLRSPDLCADIESPPISDLDGRLTTPTEPKIDHPRVHVPPNKRPRAWGTSLFAIALALGIGMVAWSRYHAGMREDAYANWNRVVAARQATTEQGKPMFSHVDLQGIEQLASSLLLRASDADDSTTTAVRQAMQQLDPNQAIATVRQAQRVIGAESLVGKLQTRQPSTKLNRQADVLKAVRDGRSKFFRISVHDSCVEDGDIIDISINGESYVSVPITNQGSTISIPLYQGVTRVTLKGVYDGGYGITVMFVTSWPCPLKLIQSA